MTFTSFEFSVFFIVVLIIHWILPVRLRNIWLLLASYFFYAFWDLRLLLLISTSISIDYIVGQNIASANSSASQYSQKTKRAWLLVSIICDLIILGFFRYYNFFADSLAQTLSLVGLPTQSFHLNLILPIGISFYTFKTLSYTIDIYYNRISATRKLTDYALYVSFFPELLAGPIDRAKNLLPQIISIRRFNRNMFFDGLNLIFLGVFKKIYVADNLRVITDKLFAINNPWGFDVVIGTYLYAIQIFCDFSGYTDIARGCGKCLGFELAINFNFPYLSANPSEFWQRWHITLSTWIRDYIFTPMGGAFHGLGRAYKNLAITMILAGLWHGASWTFVFWGAYQGLLLIVHRITQPFLKRQGALLRKIFNRKLRRAFKIIITFQFICLGWIIFRSNSLGQIHDFAIALFHWNGIDLRLLAPFYLYVFPLLAVEIIQNMTAKEEIFRTGQIPLLARTFVFTMLFYLVLLHGASAQSFIYTQF